MGWKGLACRHGCRTGLWIRDPAQDIRYEYDVSNVTECKFVENTYTDTETTDTEPPDPEGGDTNGTD